MAGADRLEGTLFGNGERTGNVDMVTVALNLTPRGSIQSWTSLTSTRCPSGRARQPHAGAPSPPLCGRPGIHRLFRVPPGRDQEGHGGAPRPDTWEVPYLPIDPKDFGRTYEAIIRINSQSGKGGVAYMLEGSAGSTCPRKLQMEFSRSRGSPRRPAERSAAQIWAVFARTYLPAEPRTRLLGYETSSGPSGLRLQARLSADGAARTICGQGNGPISALVHALRTELCLALDVLDYAEHALGGGEEAIAVAYVEARSGAAVRWGVGMDPNITTASLKALLGALDRLGLQVDPSEGLVPVAAAAAGSGK